jgi:large subunit ribosomal protein L29|tara:strand:+ start:2554 stop:2760 length:207 start_codon:yes stop_codon:yes gene_type:complete
MNKELVDLRKKNIEQLNAELISARESQFGLRIKHKTGQLNETSELTKIRKKIAMIKTIINEVKLKDKE